MDDSPKSSLLITGMHRSNTSFLAKAFQEAGLHIGSNLIPPDKYNRQGHFEDSDFVTFHEHLITKYRLQSRYSIIDYKKCFDLRLDQSDKRRAQDLIDKKYSNYPSFGWKDPRSCHFLGIWKSLIPHLKSVFIIREPHSSVQSIVKRHTQRAKFRYRPDLWYRYHRLWQVCNQQILDYHVTYPNESILIFTPEDIHDPQFEDKLNKVLSDQWLLHLNRVQLSKNYNKDLISNNSTVRRQLNQKSLKLYHQLQEYKIN